MTGLAGPAGPWGLGFSGRPFRPTVLGAPGPGFVPTRCPTNVAHPEGSFFSKKNFSTYPMNVETEPTSGCGRLDLRGRAELFRCVTANQRRAEIGRSLRVGGAE